MIPMILLAGPSASGKTEIAKILMKDFGIRKVVTHTTRPPRIGEKDGVDYHFVTREEFERLSKTGQFVETTSFNGNCYGSSKKEVADDKVLIVDPIGLETYLSLHDPRIVSFYFDTSEETRKQRMVSRGDTEEAIESRIQNDRVAFRDVPSTTFRIQNETGSLEELAKKVYQLYKEELSKLP